MISRKINLESLDESKKHHVGAYSARYIQKTREKGVPKYEFPEEGMSRGQLINWYMMSRASTAILS